MSQLDLASKATLRGITSDKSNCHSVRLSDIVYSWRPEQAPVLELPALDLFRGERLFIGGGSGSGKTTLLSLLAGIIVPQQGRVELLDIEINSMRSMQRDRFRANHIGYIHQLFNLVPYLSVIENVTLPCRFSTFRKKRALKHAGTLPEEARRLLAHLGLEDAELINRSVSELSVGQQQRVAAARALIGSPEILIADEPTSALDAANRETFIELLFKECAESKATLIFVSHDFSLAPLFDRSLQMEGGNSC